jgi:uncharacterized protein (TIGR01319 family)
MSGGCQLFVDVGSTFTKLVVADIESSELVATAQARTTIENDVTDGYESARGQIDPAVVERIERTALSSSAAGGLRIASIGLTSSLSGRAGKLAALGSGGKLVLERAGRLDEEDLRAIADAEPHILLLSGGVDGGDAAVLMQNARTLRHLPQVPATIVAGNQDVSDAAAEILRSSASYVRVADNVFPAPGRIEIDATRAAVVDLFMRHIAHAKGLDGLIHALGAECEPTPLAVTRGVEVAAEGLGSVVVVDLGGATTDVHSAGGIQRPHGNVEVPEPETSRTVEGDIGMRWGARGVIEAMGPAWCASTDAALGCDIRFEVEQRHTEPGFLARTELDRLIDATLAQAATMIALERHVGRVVVRHNPWGNRYRIQGKDLRRTPLLLCTGGIFRHLEDRDAVVRDALSDANNKMLPNEPRLVFDDDYALFAVGLAARDDRAFARRLSDQLFGSPTELNPETRYQHQEVS